MTARKDAFELLDDHKARQKYCYATIASPTAESELENLAAAGQPVWLKGFKVDGEHRNGEYLLQPGSKLLKHRYATTPTRVAIGDEYKKRSPLMAQAEELAEAYEYQSWVLAEMNDRAATLAADIKFTRERLAILEAEHAEAIEEVAGHKDPRPGIKSQLTKVVAQMPTLPSLNGTGSH